jgi:hypothetical protein
MSMRHFHLRRRKDDELATALEPELVLWARWIKRVLQDEGTVARTRPIAHPERTDGPAHLTIGGGKQRDERTVPRT